MTIRINMLSNAEAAKGQGVASAYSEQVKLIQQLNSDFAVEINSKSSNFDIYHMHSVDLPYKWRMNKHHINVSYVHFIPSHNEGSIRLPRFLDWIFRKYVENFYRKADELVVVNPAFISDLEKLKINRENITYIPNYVDCDLFHPLDGTIIPSLKEKYGLPKDKFIVLGCGQIQTRKGFDDFIETAIKNPEICFVWVGGFSFGRIMHGYKKYRQMLKNLPQNVIHLQIIDRRFMNEIYNCSDVVFMPSFLELFPMTILEAACVHKPILLRDLNLYKPILFGRYSKGNCVDEFSNELSKLKNNITYYNEQVDNAIYINKFYNKELLLKTWKDYYLRIYDKWVSKKKIKKVK